MFLSKPHFSMISGGAYHQQLAAAHSNSFTPFISSVPVGAMARNAQYDLYRTLLEASNNHRVFQTSPALCSSQLAALAAVAAAASANSASSRTSAATCRPFLTRTSEPASSKSSSTSSTTQWTTSASVVKRNISTGNRSPKPVAAAPPLVHQRTGKRKTTGRICAECKTDRTLQWRLGPDGQASLCNACGQRFQRRKQAEQFKAHQAMKQTATLSLSPKSASPTSSPEVSLLEPSSSDGHRSNIYNLLN